MEKLNENTYELILSNKFDENFWFFELGKSENQINNMNADNQFIYSFYEAGVYLWQTHKDTLINFLCDIDNRKPKKVIKEIIEGDTKEIIISIINYLVTNNIELTLAIPICAIALKKGINGLCL